MPCYITCLTTHEILTAGDQADSQKMKTKGAIHIVECCLAFWLVFRLFTVLNFQTHYNVLNMVIFNLHFFPY